MRRIILAVAVLALGAAWYAALPPSTRLIAMPASGVPPAVRGAIHVHSARSDGTGSMEEIAAAAARAGLQFVILTDHGDGTRAPSPPQYQSGVLCIDAVEIGTWGGHVLALGLPAAPYPIAGEPRDVIEDIARLGGSSIAAHPGSAKRELQWTGWTTEFDGLEWLNADSEWRDEPIHSLVRALLTYPARKSEALAGLLDRPDALLRRWDEVTRRRRVVAIAGADAHARIGLRSLGEPYDQRVMLRAPSYEQVFRLFSIGLQGVTLSGDAAADGPAVVDAIRAGRVYSVIDAIAHPARLAFTASSSSNVAAAGDVLPFAGVASLLVETQAPEDARIDLLKDGDRVASGSGQQLQYVANAAGVYRVEVSLPGAPGEPPVPWMLSNPIYVGWAPANLPAERRPLPSTFLVRYDNGPAAEWTVEQSDASAGALDVAPAVGGTQLSFRYALGGTASASPFAALVMPAGPALAQYDRLLFTARADRPMRVSVQLRTPRGAVGERWHRSVFLDQTPREIAVAFDDMTPRGFTATAAPVLSEVEAILFVVDTVNTALGGSGQIWIDDVRYGR